MIIYGCTSDLHHPPIATVGLIIVNVLVGVLTLGADPVTVHEYSLWYGAGLHPVQWLTSAFLHADSMHLVGNMVFLWPFGLLAEGKVGWWKFLLLYLAISLGECAFEQTIMLGTPDMPSMESVEILLTESEEFAAFSDDEKAEVLAMISAQVGGLGPSSLGASSVIFGLLAVCVLWAPVSEFNVWWRFGTFEMPVLMVGGLYGLLELWKWHAGGLGIGSASLHLLGLLGGFVVGIGYLRLGIPNCDGRDLFTHLFGKPIARKRSPKAAKTKRPRVTKPGGSKKSANDIAPATHRLQTGSAPSPANSWSKLDGHRKIREPVSASAGLSPDLELIRDKSVAAPVPSASETSDPGLVMRAARRAAVNRDCITVAKKVQPIDDPKLLRSFDLNQWATLYKMAVAGKHWKVAVVLLQKSIVAHPAESDARRLQLAKIYATVLKNPRTAKRVLAQVASKKLSAKQQVLLRQLCEHVNKTSA